jgi:uncharacterized membrane protein HdeD (DUF308 family)
MTLNNQLKKKFQLIYGVALLFAGLGIFYRTPHMVYKIQSFEQFSNEIWSIYFCFYFIGIILIEGGVKKIWGSFKESNGEDRKER